MAEKRLLEAVSAMSYSKLPRLEVEPTHIHPVGLCRKNGLPDLTTEDHYSYKGSYFTYPLQCHEGPKPLTHWPSAEAYSHCTGGAPGQSPRTGKPMYKPETEGLEARQRVRDSEKVSECATQERWASYMGHSGVIQQGWIQGYPTQQLPAAPAVCPTLAAPKPVYRSHPYGAESGYSPKGTLALRMQMENLSKRLEWPPPPSVLPTSTESRSYSTLGPKKALVPDAGVIQFQQGPKEGTAHSAGFLPYHKAFEKCQGSQSASSLDASSPAVCQKSVSETPGGNPSKHTWSRLPPPPPPPPPHPPPPHPSSLLVNPQDLAYQERSPTCYPLGSYPLASHEQMLLYHQSYVQAEKSNSVFTLAACKGFGSPSSEDAQLFPGSYFQQTSRSYYPGHLESYLYQAVGPSPMTPLELHSSREHEHPQNSTTKIDFAPKTPVSACALPEKAPPAYSPWRSRGSLPDWCESSRIAKEANTNSSGLQDFHPVYQVDQLSHCYNRVGKLQESGCKKDLCPPEKVTVREEESSETHKKFSLTSESRNTSTHKDESGACIVISDSPVISHNPCSKQDLPKNVLKASNIQCISNVQWSPEEQPKGVHKQREGSSTSSPPMPVINNVFSLAPYQAYLEGSADVVELDASKSCHAEELSPRSRGNSVEDEGLPWTGSKRLTNESKVDLPGWKETTCNTITKPGDADVSKNSVQLERGSGDYAGPWENSKIKLLNPNDPVSCQPSPTSCSNGRVERLAQEDHVLDLSFRTESLAEGPDLQQLPKKLEAPDSGGSKIKGEEVRERTANGQETVSETSREALVLPVNSGSWGNGHFHSSAAFLFKKFKILKTHAAEAGSGAKDVSLQRSSDAQITQQNAPLVGSNLSQAVTPSETPILQIKGFNAKLPDASMPLPPSTPTGSPVLREAQVLDPTTGKPLGQQHSPRQYFTALHTSVCAIISCSVSTSSPDQLKEWLEMAESTVELQEKTISSTKPKNGPKVSEAPKPSRGKEIWLAFKDVAVLIRKLLSQLETFLITHRCPFPHVIRAGTTFIPIHVVKEELFPNLSGVLVDHVLQDHKVELRPTTLSEEKLLRDLDLKSCTSRMLKLLALKQLPDIYPDLLNLHWHECVKQQLGPSSQAGLHASKSLVENTGPWRLAVRLDKAEGPPTTLKDISNGNPAREIPNSDVEALGTDAATESRGQDFRGKSSKDKACGLAPCLGTMCLHCKTHQPVGTGTLLRCSSPALQHDCMLNGMKVLPKEDTALETKGLALCSGAKRPSHKRPRTLELKLTAKVARRTTRASKILHLRKSVVHIQFQNALQDIQGPQVLGPSRKRKKVPPALLLKSFKRRRCSSARVSALPSEYPELVGKRIRHLYEEKDKTEAWYQGVVLRVHKHHKNPLKTVYEVKYDSEPEWQYYLEILQDYKKGWVELDE